MASQDSKYGQLDTSTITNLSFAIFPFDDFTHKRPTGDVEVLLRNGVAESHSIPNSSGYYLFLDILGERHDIVIRSDKYFEATKTIDLVELRTQDASFVKNPVIPIPLLPNASYPFSPSSTLIRGTVKSAPTNMDPNQRPVSNATV